MPYTHHPQITTTPLAWGHNYLKNKTTSTINFMTRLPAARNVVPRVQKYIQKLHYIRNNTLKPIYGLLILSNTHMREVVLCSLGLVSRCMYYLHKPMVERYPAKQERQFNYIKEIAISCHAFMM